MMTSVRWLIPQCSFNLHFSNNEWFEPPFMYLLPALCFLWRNVYLGLPLIASSGFPHNQVCFLITHTPCHPHPQPSCGSLLPVTKLPHCFGDEGQPPWPGCCGLPGKACACCLLPHWRSLFAALQPRSAVHVSDSVLSSTSRALPIPPSPLSCPSPSPSSPSFHNSYPCSRFSFRCHSYREVISDLQVTVTTCPMSSQSMCPHIRAWTRVREPQFESRVNCLLAVRSWMTYRLGSVSSSIKTGVRNSLLVRWFGLCFHHQGAQSDLWSENWDPTSCVVRSTNQ